MLPIRRSLQNKVFHGHQSYSMTSRPGDHVHPKENDVILGRGNLHASHTGNVRFYSIIDRYLPLYEAAASRSEKTKVVQDIYDTIRSAGRFVKDDPASAACVVIESKAAKKKISHAIRFRREAGKRSPCASFEKAKPNSSDPKPISSFQSAKRNFNESLRQRPQQYPIREVPIPSKIQRRNANGEDESSSDCIIPEDELSSVLLLPPHEMDEVCQMYEAFIRNNQSTDIISSRTQQTLAGNKNGTENGRSECKTDDTIPPGPTMNETTSASMFYPLNLPEWSFPPK